MLKNLASLGAAGAVQTGASRIILEMRPRTTSCPKSLIHKFSNVPFSLQAAPPYIINTTGIDNRRHCMGPSVDLFEPESHIRKLRFSGKCPRLTVEKNGSNPSISHGSNLEIRPNRPVSCPQKLASMKLHPGYSEKKYSKDTLVKSVLKSKLSGGFINTATSEQPKPEAPKTFSSNISSRPTSKIAARENLNRFSFQNILNSKRPISSSPRLFKMNKSSLFFKKPSVKTNEYNKKKSVEKGLNWHFGSRRTVSSFERKGREISKTPNFVDKGKVPLSTKKSQNVNSRILIKSFSGQPEIRTLPNRISSMSRFTKSCSSIEVPSWRATNPSNVAITNRLARPSRSVTGVSSSLADGSPEKSQKREINRPFETKSSPSVFDPKAIPINPVNNPYKNPINNVGENAKKSELITLLEPQSTFKGWRGHIKTRIQKPPVKKPEPELDLDPTDINCQVARPHTCKTNVFTRTETNKLHPGTMNANKQIAMIYKDKFDPALLDRFRYRNVTAINYSKPSNYKNATTEFSHGSRSTQSGVAKKTLLAQKHSFTSSAVVKALEIRNSMNFVKKAPTLPGGRRDSFVVRPVSTARHAQSAGGWVPFIRAPLMSTKPRAEKNFQNADSKENIDKSASIPSRRPLRQWREKAEKWADSVSRRPERESKWRRDKPSFSSFKRKANEKLEDPNAFKMDNTGVGSSASGSRDGQRNIPPTVQLSTSARNIASEVWSSMEDLQRKIHSGYMTALRATSPMLRIPPMLPDHIRYGLSKED